MDRLTLIIASRQPSVAAALHQSLSLILPSGELPHHISHVGFRCAAELFNVLDELPPGRLLNTMVIFDAGGEDVLAWDVMQMNRERGLAAQLVLAYPEIFFVFVGASRPVELPTFNVESSELQNYTEEQRPDFAGLWPVATAHHFVADNNLLDLFELVRLHAQGFRTLFDPTGLRSLLKLDLQHQLQLKLSDTCAGVYRRLSTQRLQCPALVAEDETQFLYLNGYATYKFGCRTWLAHTNSEFLRLADDGDSADSGRAAGQRFNTAVMDLDLTYSDDEGSSKEDRKVVRREFLHNNRVINSIVITSFPKPDGAEGWGGRLAGQVNSWLGRDGRKTAPLDPKEPWLRRSVVLSKPYGGFFDLLEKRPADPSVNVLDRAFKAAYYHMSNDVRVMHRQAAERRKEQQERSPSTHSAPYSCSVIATRLLSRAHKLKTNEQSTTEQWIQAAMLAGEAKELLGGLSLSTTYHALALQNEAEVRAEVSFIGMAAEIKVDRRLEELDSEVNLVQQATVGGNRDGVQDVAGRLNCLMVTTHNLRLRFTEGEQMQAAELCLWKFANYQHRLRHLPRTHGLGRRSGGAMNLLFKMTMGYPEIVTRAGTSLRRLLAVSMGWILAFFLLYLILFSFHPRLKNEMQRPVIWAAGHALFTFIELQPGLSEAEDLKRDEMNLVGGLGGGAEASAGDTGGGQGTNRPASRPLEYSLFYHYGWIMAYWVLLISELSVAYVHLGLFVSVMYRRITKRAP
jgi:hypothetical protein